MRLALILVGGLGLWGKSVADEAVEQQMRMADPAVQQVRVLKRVAVDPELEMVVAWGVLGKWPIGETGWVSWEEQSLIGLFLQKRSEAGKIYRIAVEHGMKDGECFARVERMSASDVVIGCKPEKVGMGMHRKFVYDLRAKQLVKFFEYVPFSMERVRVAGDRVIWAGRNDSQKVEVVLNPDGVWGARSMGTAGQKSWEPRVLRFGPTGEFQVTEGTAEVVEHRNGKKFRLKQLIGEEQIGVWQVDGAKLWFGKTFYDGEGMTGEGGFGYFDTATRSFKMFSPEAVKKSSVSALLVEPERIWMGLMHRGEYGPSSMGVVEFDRSTQATRKIPSPGIVNGIARSGDRIVMATDFGAEVWDGQLLRRFFVDMTSDGRMRVVEGIAVP